MRFSIAATAFVVTVASAGNVVYKTEEVTITSCHPTVTYCPARSTVVSTTTYAASVTTYAGEAAPPHPTGYANVSTSAVPTYAAAETYPAGVPVETYPAENPVETHPASVPTYPASNPIVQTISTCVPTVIYVTVTPTGAPTAPVVTPPVNTYEPKPTGGVFPPHNNATHNNNTKPPNPIEGSASNVQGSIVFALAGLAAFMIFA
ncbi:uncharacterized protein RAG0_09372 [Rhynchosporium agropyri]|uniref:Uncharacterized protein n=1 Tax=Rhynchosporium agropyri TaxID=914238 RepID=A0A1E1KV86_9HELO|nr:uncharacterized protein RAG0_09372 [Rhynchosporium agropyri]